MPRYSPAGKAFQRILKKHGFEFLPDGSLTGRVITENRYARPVDVKIVLSTSADRARIEVCKLSGDSEVFRRLCAELDMLIFDY